MHMPYDDTAYYLPPLRDSEYDMAMALDMRPLAYAQQLPENLDGFVPASSSFVDHVQYEDSPAYALQYPILLSEDLVELRQPAPRRALSPEFLFPAEHPLMMASTSAQPVYPQASGSLFASGSFAQPSLFAPATEGQPQHAVVDEPPPPPPPSWAMSGSLDPVTGIYQTAPEHPRVRTQQACEKCRGRKAKCSGERPCQRCVNRGLHCEYAPERKMRGPNKVKRVKGSSVESRGTARRASVASSVATTSSEDEPHAPGSPPFTSAPRGFTMRLDPPEGADEGAAPSPEADAPTRRARPPPINLDGTRLYDQAPVSLMQDVPAFAFDASAGAARRASLPAYLPETHVKRAAPSGIYSPSRGLDVIETTPRPRSSPAHPMELDGMLSLLPTTHSGGSSSGATSSTPITPLNMPEFGELMYPPVLSQDGAMPHGLTPDFAAFEHFGGGAWLGQDVDATPTLATEGKSLRALEHEFLQDM